MKKFQSTSFLMTISIFLLAILTGQGNAAWPEGPINVVIQWRAGAGTDIITRAYAALMEKHIGVPINCTNREGAVGALAMDAVYSKPPKGDWWLGASQYSKPLRVMGYSKLCGWKDWQYYKCADGLSSIAVKSDSPLKTFADFLEAVRKNPGKSKVANAGMGSLSHEANEMLIREAKVNFAQIPYKGDAGGVLACLQGEVDAVQSTLTSQIELIRAGKLRSLTLLKKEPLKLKEGEVLRPITDFVPTMAKYLPFGTMYTLGLRRETPVDILEKVKKAFLAAVNTPEFEDVLEKRYFIKSVAIGEEADRQAAISECFTAWLAWDMKIEGVKVNPADLGLPRPENFESWWPPKDYKPRLSSK